MTLLVKNIQYPLPNGGLLSASSHSLVGCGVESDASWDQFINEDLTIKHGDNEDRSLAPGYWSLQSGAEISTVTDDHHEILLDENGRIAAYVSFEEFYDAVVSLEERQRRTQSPKQPVVNIGRMGLTDGAT